MVIFIIQKGYHQTLMKNTLIKEKFMKADHPLRFINSEFNEFQRSNECGDESFIIPPTLFKITKPFISIEIPYYELG